MASWEPRLLVVGTGLIGTSVGLAASRAGADVRLYDTDPDRLAVAVAAGAGGAAESFTDAAEEIDLAVVAVPPARTGAVVVELLAALPHAVVTHVSSVASLPQAEVEASTADVARFVGGHPIAGRELSGPAHATGDLLRERPWVVIPAPGSAAGAVQAVTDLAAACGALPVRLDAATHDALLARLSHVPQLVASALAASLSVLSDAEAALAGTGIRDTTRLADSDPQLWAEIVAANAAPVATALRDVVESLAAIAGALDGAADADVGAAVRSLLERGRAGRALLPGKHGGAPIAVVVVEVVIPDRPGALADLLGAVAAEEVNLEDLRVEHAPGQPLGVAQLMVAPVAAEALASALRASGWSVSTNSGAR